MAITLDLDETARRVGAGAVMEGTPCRIADVAWLLDVNRTVVDKWVARGTFAAPDGTFPAGSTPWWYWRTVAGWAARQIQAQLMEGGRQ